MMRGRDLGTLNRDRSPFYTSVDRPVLQMVHPILLSDVVVGVSDQTDYDKCGLIKNLIVLNRL